LAEKAEIFREKGTNRSAFMRGEIKKYTWVSEGSSYVLSDILAAVLMEQWKKLAEINSRRRRIYEIYVDGLSGAAASGKVFLPVIPKDCVSSYHLFHLLMPSMKLRDRCLDALRAQGIGATFHYQSLHNSPFGRKALGCRERMPVSEMASDCLLRLPLYPDLSRADAAFICGELNKALARL
jgi:dTDP-4-amino-4,6-dideoxygalactose transaminase